MASDPLPDKILFYSVRVTESHHGKPGLRWGPVFDTPKEAWFHGKTEVNRGWASLAFVVQFMDGEKTPLSQYTYPNPAKRIIGHWEKLWDATEDE